ncbi:NAD(P)-binding protein [Xylariaceae sp. FL0594]|nr:NAD(P)-binding protein [Xylariaceae sp. FL0594]
MSTDTTAPSPPTKKAGITLDGGVALITGAGSGIGKDTEFAFTAASASAVVFADIDLAAAERAAEESKTHAASPDEFKALAVCVDVTKDESVEAMVKKTVKEFGRVDYLVNSAGVKNNSKAAIYHTKLDVFQQAMDINATGTLRCIRAVTNVMREQTPRSYTGRNRMRDVGKGCVVNIASVFSNIAMPRTVSYVASKHAVMGITRAAAPSSASPILRHITLAASPYMRLASVDEVSEYIVFLCSPFASYINGTGLTIDAGASCNMMTSNLTPDQLKMLPEVVAMHNSSPQVQLR